jgi:uncharacterized ferritin-like protein (DUF455 family)
MCSRAWRSCRARWKHAVWMHRRRFAGVWRKREITHRRLHDEIGHVLIGNHWFRYLCSEAGADPHATYAQLAQHYHAPKLRGPFNFEARREAGFDEAELRALAGLDDIDSMQTSLIPR